MAHSGAAAQRVGKHFRSCADRMRFGETEVLNFLKVRVRSIALDDLEDWIMREVRGE